MVQKRQGGLRDAAKRHRRIAAAFLGLFLVLAAPHGARAAEDCRDYFAEYRAFHGDFQMPPAGSWLERLWNKVSFREVRLRRRAATERNKEVIAQLNADPVLTASGSRKGSLSPGEIEALLASVSSHPIASFSRLQQYDPEGEIGFCFGRAMTAHLEALWHYGLANGSVKKIWAVGPIKGLSANWRYHVTTAVRGEDGKWYTIDPLFGRPLTVEDWHTRMRAGMSFTSDMLLFASDANRLFPSGPGTYGVLSDNGDRYKKYYDDVLDGYRREFRDKLTARRANR